MTPNNIFHARENADKILFDLATKLKDYGVIAKIGGNYEYSDGYTSLDFVERVTSIDFSEHDKEFTDKIKELQSEVEKYRKAFEDAKKERDCQIAKCQKKVEELEKKSDFCFPEEPIKIADLIIHGWETSWDYKHLSISELRQIAEHLLVFCNHNREVEE